MGHLNAIMEEAKAMQATIERQRREHEKTLDNMMKLRAENEKLTEALQTIRAMHKNDVGPPATYYVAKTEGIIEKAIGKEPSPKSPTLQDIREACPVELTLEVMDYISRRRFPCTELYSAFEAGANWFSEQSDYCRWLAKVLGVTPAEAYAACQASYIKARED